MEEIIGAIGILVALYIFNEIEAPKRLSYREGKDYIDNSVIINGLRKEHTPLANMGLTPSQIRSGAYSPKTFAPTVRP